MTRAGALLGSQWTNDENFYNPTTHIGLRELTMLFSIYIIYISKSGNMCTNYYYLTSPKYCMGKRMCKHEKTG